MPRTERSEGRGVFALVMRCRVKRLKVYSRVGKNPRKIGAGCDIRRGSPAGAGAAGWFLPGGFSRKAGSIKHQLVFEVLVCWICAQKPAEAMTYTDLLPAVLLPLNA